MNSGLVKSYELISSIDESFDWATYRVLPFNGEFPIRKQYMVNGAMVDWKKRGDGSLQITITEKDISYVVEYGETIEQNGAYLWCGDCKVKSSSLRKWHKGYNQAFSRYSEPELIAAMMDYFGEGIRLKASLEKIWAMKKQDELPSCVLALYRQYGEEVRILAIKYGIEDVLDGALINGG